MSASNDDNQPEKDETLAAKADALDSDSVSEETGDSGEGDEPIAAAIGYQRYVILGFVVVWLLAGLVLSRLIVEAWSALAGLPKVAQAAPWLEAVPYEGELLSRSSISLLIGVLLGSAIVWNYYRRPSVREWADEVADEVSKVKWPTRKEIGSYTVIVIAGSALLTGYLALLDRFWAFVTNLIYST